jgi:hypothetical protein
VRRGRHGSIVEPFEVDAGAEEASAGSGHDDPADAGVILAADDGVHVRSLESVAFKVFAEFWAIQDDVNDAVSVLE